MHISRSIRFLLLRRTSHLLYTCPRQVDRFPSLALTPYHLNRRPLSISSSAFTSSPTSSSINPSEISHFNALASSWWDPYGSSRLLHLMNPHRHDFISSCLASQPSPPLPPLRYLDIGCGGGIFTESVARLATTASVVGIDPSSEVLNIAEAHAQRDPLLQTRMAEGRFRYLNTSIEALTVPAEREKQYDILSLFEVVEHVSDPVRFLGMCLPFVRPGGWLVLSTIARTWTSWLTTKVVAEDIMGIVPRGTHDWSKYIDEREMRRWFEEQEGWGSMRAVGMIYVPGFGWKEVQGGEKWGNYFMGVQRLPDDPR